MDFSQLDQKPLPCDPMSTVQPSLRAVFRMHMLYFLCCFSNYRVSTLKTGNFSSLPTAWHRVSAQNIFNE